MFMFAFINVMVLQCVYKLTFEMYCFINFLKINCSDSRTPTNKCSNIRSLHSEATMSKTRVFMLDGFRLSCKEVRTGSLDWMEQD